jgi:hypothetical protein
MLSMTSTTEFAMARRMRMNTTSIHEGSCLRSAFSVRLQLSVTQSLQPPTGYIIPLKKRQRRHFFALAALTAEKLSAELKADS